MKNKNITFSIILFTFFLIVKSVLVASNSKVGDVENLLETKQIVSVGGSVTETIFELGLGQLVIAVDVSSTLPKQVKNLPQVGYIRKISSEGVLSMRPNLILTTSEIGPPNAVRQIKDSGVNIEIYNAPKSIDGIVELVRAISKELNMADEAQQLTQKIYSSVDSIKSISSTFKRAPRIAFFLNPSSGSFNASGSGTNADYLIRLLGGVNVFSSDFKKYQKVSKEQILKYNPDILLVATHFPNKTASIHFSGKEEFIFLKAVKSNNLIEISMPALSMGPGFASRALSILKRINIEF